MLLFGLNSLASYHEDMRQLVSLVLQLPLFLLLMIGLHEFGHYVMGRLLRFPFVYGASVCGMVTPYRWYPRAPMHLWGGSTLMYKPVHRGPVTNKEMVLYALGGGIANALALGVLVVLAYVFASPPGTFATLHYVLYANGLLLLLTWVPSGNNDMGIVVQTLRGDQTFTERFHVQSMHSDPAYSSEALIDTVHSPSDPTMKSFVDLAKIEVHARQQQSFFKIYERSFPHEYPNGYLLWLLQFLQSVFQYLDTREVTPDMDHILSDSRADQYPVLEALKQYVYTQDPQWIETMDHFKFQMGPITNVTIINHIIRHIR